MPATVPACDHIEEINFPVETLRSDYLVTLPNNTNGTPAQYVKIVGTVAGTTLTYDPAVAGAPPTLGAGQASFFHATQNFHVTSSQPVFVGQFMESENNFTTSDTAGDPALSAAVATAQFRNNYQFVAPANYEQNWVNVIAPTGALGLHRRRGCHRVRHHRLEQRIQRGSRPALRGQRDRVHGRPQRREQLPLRHRGLRLRLVHELHVPGRPEPHAPVTVGGQRRCTILVRESRSVP